MIIILDGIKNSGKTNYANELCKQFNCNKYTYFDDLSLFSEKKENIFDDISTPIIQKLCLLDYVFEFETNCIIDSSIPYELVYMDDLDRYQFGKSNKTGILLDIFEKKLSIYDDNYIYILLDCGYESIKDRYLVDGSNITKSIYLKKRKVFQKAFDYLHINKIKINTDVFDVGVGAKRILKFVNSRAKDIARYKDN